MRDIVINNSLKFIQKNISYNDEKLAELKYGLEGIYILITKAIVILSAALLLGIFKEVIIFTLTYSLIRMFSFGLHATKSWICLISSLIIFLSIPYICLIIKLPIFIKSIIGIICILFILKNSPADTYKRPIINKKRRERYKFLSTIISIIMIITALYINNNFLSNALVFSNVVQIFMISPIIYRLFKLPYNNYKRYQM